MLNRPQISSSGPNLGALREEKTMKSDNRNLGMDRSISRRDVLLGMGALAASTFVPGRAFADEV
jgi:hypothetical protein